MRHYVVFGSEWRKVQFNNDQKVKITIAETNSAPFSKVNIRQGPIKVPSGVKLYLRPFTDNSYLMRLHNFNIKQVTVQLPDGWTVSEMTLSANQLRKDWEAAQYKWNKEKEV